MANKKKGQLATFGEWHKHLRKAGKKVFWRANRAEEKKLIENEKTQHNNE